MKKLTAIAASLAVAGMFTATGALAEGTFADEPILAHVNSINLIAINDDDTDDCKLILDVTTIPEMQNGVVDAVAMGTQLCISLEAKYLAGTEFDADFLVNFFTVPVTVRMVELWQPTKPLAP